MTAMQPNDHDNEFRHMPASSNSGGVNDESNPTTAGRVKWSSATEIRTKQRQFAPNNS
jgi:hypothetical protein